MGVSHHSNYLKYFEMARVGWLRERGLMNIHYPYSDMALAVIESSCRHMQPVRFGEEIRICLQVRREKLKIEFRYKVLNSDQEVLATGDTVLVPINSALKPTRIPQPLIEALEQESWTETWP